MPRVREGGASMLRSVWRNVRAAKRSRRMHGLRREAMRVIHYHGGSIKPTAAAIALWTRRHGLTSFADPEQVALMAEVCQSFILDNGAFTHWRAGRGEVDVAAYGDWVAQWCRHPGFDFCLIPDVIDGSEFDNDRMLARWFKTGLFKHGVPVWHLHESIDRLRYMSIAYPRVALGSSGAFATPGDEAWWLRMEDVMAAVCDEQGRPLVKLHGLRMLNPEIFSVIPLSSADSCNVGRNISIDKRWSGPYPPVTDAQRALVLCERIEHARAAVRWSKRRGVQQTLELF